MKTKEELFTTKYHRDAEIIKLYDEGAIGFATTIGLDFIDVDSAIMSQSRFYAGYDAIKEQYEELRTLVNGVYEIVEIYATDNTPYNKEWKRKWLETARKHGCSADM